MNTGQTEHHVQQTAAPADIADQSCRLARRQHHRRSGFLLFRTQDPAFPELCPAFGSPVQRTRYAHSIGESSLTRSRWPRLANWTKSSCLRFSDASHAEMSQFLRFSTKWFRPSSRTQTVCGACCFACRFLCVPKLLSDIFSGSILLPWFFFAWVGDVVEGNCCWLIFFENSGKNGVLLPIGMQRHVADSNSEICRSVTSPTRHFC